MMRAALLLALVQQATALRVTVLGGNGYVGQRVCEKLVARGCDRQRLRGIAHRRSLIVGAAILRKR